MGSVSRDRQPGSAFQRTSGLNRFGLRLLVQFSTFNFRRSTFAPLPNPSLPPSQDPISSDINENSYAYAHHTRFRLALPFGSHPDPSCRDRAGFFRLFVGGESEFWESGAWAELFLKQRQ